MSTHLTLYFTSNPGNGAVQVPGLDNSNSPADMDTRVLNYALALETLEADLYKQALARLTSGGTDDFGNAITGLGIASSEPDVQYLTEFGIVEAKHQLFLETALSETGSNNWVKKAGAAFDFGINSLDRKGVVSLVYNAELHGVSAYLGAIPFFGTKTYVADAAAILGTEARHTTFVAALLNGPLFNSSPKLATAPLAGDNQGKDYPLKPDQILYQGGTVASDLISGGTLGPISGPNGFVVAGD